MDRMTLDKLVAFAKSQGFVFQGSEIYGGLANTWDYGPLGVLLKNHIKKAWMKKFVQENFYNVGLDSAILMNPETWVASGHVGGFSDPLTDCKACQTRYRADKLIDTHSHGSVNADGWSKEELLAYLLNEQVKCPNCGKVDYTEIRHFNLMFKTNQGVLESSQNTVYLRPETAQGIFVNFKNIQRSTRKKVPFGVGQIGKAFRNEITPGNFIFRTREFEQMELEFFCKPGTEMAWFDYWRQFCFDWLVGLGIRQEDLRMHDHEPEKLSHYSNATTDIEYRFPWGFDELWGIASRTDFDLKAHQAHSKQALDYLDPETNERYVPYVVEPSLGVERLFLTILFNAYDEEVLENGETREVMRLHPALAPYSVAVLPLMKKYHTEKAQALWSDLARHFSVTYDESASIGKRYRRQDAMGTVYTVTIDEETLNHNTVTVRHRDTMQQDVVKVDELVGYLQARLMY